MCIFCKIVAGEIPAAKVYEDRRTLAFMDIKPINRGHVLVIPKAHAETIFDISENDFAACAKTVVKVAAAVREVFHPEGINIFQNNGEVAGQVVKHLHLHIVPRFTNDGVEYRRPTAAVTPAELESDAKRISEVLRARKV